MHTHIRFCLHLSFLSSFFQDIKLENIIFPPPAYPENNVLHFINIGKIINSLLSIFEQYLKKIGFFSLQREIPNVDFHKNLRGNFYFSFIKDIAKRSTLCFYGCT